MRLELILRERNGRTVETVQLTEANHNAVLEWVPGKSFHGPAPDHAITGLTVFTTPRNVKAEYGDWIVRYPEGDFYRFADSRIDGLFGTPSGTRVVELPNGFVGAVPA
jgi:hypothetical protein